MPEEDRLAKYIVDDLFKWFKDERSTLLEPTWRRNYDAFRGKYDSDSLKRWKATEGKDWRSRVFVRLTKQKVVTGFNQVTAIALQGNEIRWDITPTPLPERRPGVYLDENEARIRCDLMKKQIQDDFTQCKASKIMAGSILEMALYGLSWLWGPIIRSYTDMVAKFSLPKGADDLYYSPEMIQTYGRHTLMPQTVHRPVVENVSVWNVFWDLETADHQKGHGIIIREMMSKGRFLDLQDQPGYDSPAINEIAEQFRSTDEDSEDEDDSQGPVREGFNKRKRVIPVYFFRGRAPKDKIKNYDYLSDKNARELEIQCVVAKAKTPRVIWRPKVNPLPYRNLYLASWESLPHEAGGVGIPENMEDSQMIVNGLTRAMLDNKALASNLLMWWNPKNLAPGQNKSLYPGKSFETNESVEDVRSALQFFAPPDITGNTPKLIELFKKFADEESGLPRTMEGQQVDSRTTAYEISKMAESGNKLIGGTIRNHDEGHTEPMVRGFYHWHMLTNRNERLKGDYTVQAKGFESYIEKGQRGQDILQILNLALSSMFTAQFTKVLPFLRDLVRTKDLDPDRYFPSEKELTDEAEKIARFLPKMPQQTPQPGL